MVTEVVVSSDSSNGSSIVRLEVRIQVGDSLMAASDDPLFLGLRGREGREFRLVLARGRSLRRGSEDRFVLGAPDAPETNVEMPELNDPAQPALHVGAVEGAYLRKGFDPIPNVRAVGELDDRLEVIEAEIEIHADGQTKPLRFQRIGPIWLGLVSGLHLELARAPDEG
jgi:hypothetical protein